MITNRSAPPAMITPVLYVPDVRAAVAWEAGALALAGALLGIPIGIAIARLAWARTARGIGVLVVQRVPFTVVLVVAPAAVAIAIAP